MEVIKNENAPRFRNNASCIAIEYEFKGEEDFNIAGIELRGRYPEAGFALNTISKELMYVKSGDGTLVTADRRTPLSPGDAVLIQPHQKYYLEGTLELVISSAPAWRPEQHQTVLD